MKKNRGILSLVLTVVLIAFLGFTTVVGIGKKHSGAAENIKLGLDLADMIDLHQ